MYLEKKDEQRTNCAGNCDSADFLTNIAFPFPSPTANHKQLIC